MACTGRVGKTYVSPASHGEGRFVAPKEWIDCGCLQTDRLQHNMRTSMAMFPWMKSGTSTVLMRPSKVSLLRMADASVKMAHAERRDNAVAINIYGEQDLKIFESGVAYFK